MSVADLTQSLAQDPVAVQQLCRAAYERAAALSRKNPSGREHQLRTLEQVVQVLGTAQVGTVLRAMPVLQENVREASIQKASRYLALLGQSVLAAEQARRWAILQNQRNYEEVWLAALLYNQASWHLAWHEEERLGELAQLLLTPHTPEYGEKRVFGSSLLALSRRWVEWQTPMELLKASVDPQQLPNRQELVRLAHNDFEMVQRFNSRPQVWVVFANQAAAALRFRGSHAWVHLRFISGLFRMEPGRAWNDLVNNALRVAASTSFPGQAAASLLWDCPDTQRRRLTLPWWLTLQDTLAVAAPVAREALNQVPPVLRSELPGKKAERLNKTTSDATTSEVAVEAGQPRTEDLKKTAVQAPVMPRQVPAEPSTTPSPLSMVEQGPDDHFLPRFTERLNSLGNLNQQLLHLVQSWHEGVHLSRVLLMVFNTERDSLRTLLARGWDSQSPAAGLRWATAGNLLIGSLSKQASFVLLDSASIDRYRMHLPNEVTDLLQLPCMLASIMAGDRPLGLLLADCAGKNPTARQLQACRMSLPAFHKGVERLRRQAATQKNLQT